MPKRKRSGEDDLSPKLAELRQELARALKAAKGFERQRLSKRFHAEQAQDKKQRLEREIAVLKSLDLQQTAQAHLASSLVRFKAIAEHPAVPDEIKNGAPRPELTDEEKTAMHNVTSGLYNRQNVRDVIDKALRAVCLALEIPMPEKKGKKSGKAEKEQPETTKRSRDGSVADAEPSAAPAKKRRVEDDAGSSDGFEGFSDDDDDDDDGTDGDEEDNSELDAEDEETAVERYASRLGGSDDSGSDSENATALRAKYAALLGMRGDEPASSDSDSAEEDDLGIDMAAALGSDSDAESGDLSDVPPKPKGKDAPKAPKREPLPSPSPPPPARKPKASKLGSTTFLPSLMGGYLSGSESASDVDVAPRKKRLGQRQRQAIAERKHGEKANHVRNGDKKGRDSGWDARRGAVDGDEQGRGRQPWKKGAANPLGGKGQRGGGAGRQGGGGRQDRQDRAPSKAAVVSRDDQGSLHPSWEARKKAKETQSVAFQGSKITF